MKGGTHVLVESILASLSPNTKYYIRAYATNSAGTGYGSELTFITGQVSSEEFHRVLREGTGKVDYRNNDF